MAALAASLPSGIPEDDVRLKNAVQAGASLEALAKGAVRFSRKFTVQELRDRWHSLLYDPVISAEASSRMVEFEHSGSSKSISSGVGVGKAEFTLKRKVDSVHKLYHALRKKICIRPLNLPHFSRLDSIKGNAAIDDGTACQGNHEIQVVSSINCIQNRSELRETDIDRLQCAPQDNQFAQESVERDIFEHERKHEGPGRTMGEALVDFENCPGFEGMGPPSTFPETDVSFQSLEYSSSQPRTPLWKTKVGTPTRGMTIDFNHEVKAQVLEAAFIPPDDIDEKKIILPAVPEAGLADRSDSLLNLENDDQLHTMVADAKDTIDKSCSNCDNPIFISCHISTHPEDGPDIKEPYMCIAIPAGSSHEELEVTDGQSFTGNGIQHACNSEINVQPSSLTENSQPHDHPEREKKCILNSEDPEIPCNDDFIPGKMVTSSAMPACRKEVSDPAPSLATPRHNAKKLSIMMNEEKSAPCFTASQMGGSYLFPGCSNNHQSFSCRVKAQSIDFVSPLSVPGKDDNENADPSQCRSTLATQKSVARVDVEQDFLHACTGTDKSFSSLDQEESESGEDIPSFSDIESLILDMDLCPDDGDSYFIKEVSRYQCEDSKRTIMKLEQCARSAMQRAISYQGAFAIFYGRRLKHYIKATEIVLGRATDEIDVDIDLGREGHANKISRRQALIKMKQDGSFFLKNLGKSCMFLNGREIATGQTASLSSSSLIEIREMAFMFEINPKSVREYLENATKRNEEENSNFEWSERVP